MIRILGVDPGSRLTGYAVIEVDGKKLRLIAQGTLKLRESDSAEISMRLLELHRRLNEIIEIHRPSEIAVEKIFFAKNANSALVLGQARGVALLCGALAGLHFHEYAATLIKQTVAGSGRADKIQVAKMVQILLGRQDFSTFDASDAAAVAVCHALHLRFPLTPTPSKDKTLS